MLNLKEIAREFQIRRAKAEGGRGGEGGEEEEEGAQEKRRLLPHCVRPKFETPGARTAPGDLSSGEDSFVSELGKPGRQAPLCSFLSIHGQFLSPLHQSPRCYFSLDLRALWLSGSLCTSTCHISTRLRVSVGWASPAFSEEDSWSVRCYCGLGRGRKASSRHSLSPSPESVVQLHAFKRVCTYGCDCTGVHVCRWKPLGLCCS